MTALENGSFLLGVHIADVSHYVREHTELDREAYARGNLGVFLHKCGRSIFQYFADCVVCHAVIGMNDGFHNPVSGDVTFFAGTRLTSAPMSAAFPPT